MGACFVNSPRDCSFARFQDDGGFRVAQVLKRREHDRRAKHGRQAIERVKKVRVLLAQLRALSRVPTSVDSNCQSDTRVSKIDRGPSTTIALHVERPMQGDAVEPGEEFAAAFELGELGVGPQKGVLRDVIRVASASRHVEGEREDARAVTLDELVESPGISSPCRLHQGGRLPSSDLHRALALSGGTKPRGWGHAP